MFGLTVQDLVGQVVDDVPIVAGKPGDEVGGIVAALDRERGQLQGSDPALRPTLQRHDIPPRQLQLHHPVQVRGGLLGRKAQIRRADLDEFATPAPATERQCRVGAGGDHEVQPVAAGAPCRYAIPSWMSFASTTW